MSLFQRKHYTQLGKILKETRKEVKATAGENALLVFDSNLEIFIRRFGRESAGFDDAKFRKAVGLP